ncbi:hypothetical protein SDC9_133857 [bioreactor metagenome]|uniref:Uncharacterized protein n=1 Tax=bioreactor metagenome TaxID=1076179 RepID=A0A645DC51_9ZZZZ
MHPGDLILRGEIFRDRQRIFTMLFHAKRQRLKTKIEVEGVLRGLDRAKVPHKLRRRLRDVCLFAKAFGIYDAVIRFVRRGEAGEAGGIVQPVEVAAVYNATADADRVAVHVFRGRVGDDIRAPLKRTAVDRGCKRVVDDERHAVRMREARKLLDIQDGNAGVCDGFAKKRLGVGAKILRELLFRQRLIDKRAFDAHFFQRYAEEIEGAAVDRGGGDEVVARFADVEDREKVRSLAGRGQHRSHAALQGADLGSDGVVGRVLQTGIEISLRLKVEQSPHIVAGVIFKSCALVDRQLAGHAVSGGISFVQALRFHALFHPCSSKRHLKHIIPRCKRFGNHTADPLFRRRARCALTAFIKRCYSHSGRTKQLWKPYFFKMRIR